MEVAHRIVKQAVVVSRPSIDPSQLTEEIVFFRPNGTPFDVGDIVGPELPADLEEHVLSHRPHQNAESGLNLAAVYQAGRI